MQRWVVLVQKCLTQINIMYGGNVSYGEGNEEGSLEGSLCEM